MNEIFFSYITEFTSRRTRGFAFVHVMGKVNEHRAVLSDDNVKYLMACATKFSEEYKKAWPWSRPGVVAKAMRNFQIVSQNIL